MSAYRMIDADTGKVVSPRFDSTDAAWDWTASKYGEDAFNDTIILVEEESSL